AVEVANIVIGTVEHTMLEGDGLKVKGLVADIKKRVPAADIRVYDKRGVEVFAPPGPAPDPGSLPDVLRAALADGKRRTAGDYTVRPIAHEERCEKCHEAAPLRGAIGLHLDRAQ